MVFITAPVLNRLLIYTPILVLAYCNLALMWTQLLPRRKSAIRCACSIRDAVRSMGVEVRLGLHTGECVIAADSVEGVAVHIAARIADLAGPERGGNPPGSCHRADSRCWLDHGKTCRADRIGRPPRPSPREPPAICGRRSTTSSRP